MGTVGVKNQIKFNTWSDFDHLRVTGIFKTFSFERAATRALGVRIDARTGKVRDVTEVGQCNEKGVQVGWRVTGINGKPFDDRLFREVVQAELYELTFDTQQS